MTGEDEGAHMRSFAAVSCLLTHLNSLVPVSKHDKLRTAVFKIKWILALAGGAPILFTSASSPALPSPPHLPMQTSTPVRPAARAAIRPPTSSIDASPSTRAALSTARASAVYGGGRGGSGRHMNPTAATAAKDVRVSNVTRCTRVFNTLSLNYP